MKLLCLAMLAFTFSLSAFAQESVIKLEPANVNQPKGDDVDAIITNPKMRAETGSKSKYSIASAFGFSAGSIETPFATRRPNLSGATGTTDITALTGSVSGKLGFTTTKALMAGVGMRFMTPLQNGTPEGYSGDKLDVDNPYANYQYLYRWSGIQSAFILNETFYTNSNLVRAGWVTGWSVSQNNNYEIGRFTLGVNVYTNLAYYNNNSQDQKPWQSDYAFGAVPAVEYHLTDKWNLRTDSNLLSFQHVRSERNPHSYQQQHWAQTFSLGYALTRDLYLSAGMQWLAEDIRADRTTTWMTANVNVF